MRDPLLAPDNHELFEHVRLRLVCRDPIVPWEDIAEEFCIDDVDDLARWFIEYKLPRSMRIIPKNEGFRYLRDPALRAEHARLRAREKELLTIATEAPAQLEKIQRQIVSLEAKR